jgi:hypothetical protein
MKACWDEAPCQLCCLETRELRSPGTVIRNKGRTHQRHDMCGCPKYAHRVLLVTSLMGGGNMSVLDRETRWIMAFRYVHIRPNLPLEIRAVEGVRSPECTYSVTSCDFVGDGRGLGQPGCARPRGSATMSRSRVWRQLPRKQTGCLEDKKPMKRTAWFGVRGPAPRGGLRGS